MKEVIFAFLGSMLPGILFNVRKERLLLTGLSGALGWLVYSLMLQFNGSVISAVFLGSVVVGLYSEIMARLIKTPATVFSISGIFPLVPGIGAYNTVQLIVENKTIDALGKGIETVASAAAIAFGVMFVSVLFRLFKLGVFTNDKCQEKE